MCVVLVCGVLSCRACVVCCFRFSRVPLCKSERISGFFHVRSISVQKFRTYFLHEFFDNITVFARWSHEGIRKFENSKFGPGTLPHHRKRKTEIRPAPCCPLAVWTKKISNHILPAVLRKKVALQIVESPKCLLIYRSFIVF